MAKRQGKVRVGIIGSQFEADIHAAAFRSMPEEVEVVAVASPTPGHPEALAQRYGIPRVFHDYRTMLREEDIELVTIAAPNYLHAQMTIDAAQAGKHIVCEKPLCMTLEEADEMLDVCRRQGVLLMYAEELLFTPKYVQAKRMADEGAFGKIYLVKQNEKHFGPHAEWFWDVQRSGGGVLMDMGCHSIAFCYWFLNRPRISTVQCQLGTTKGWSYPVFEELWNYGFPQEMLHFARCARGKEEPQATGEDGRLVLEVLYAAYQSARTGSKVSLPFRPAGVRRPIDLWLGPS